MNRNPVKQDIADAERLEEIVRTSSEYEASHLVKKLGLTKHLPLRYRHKEEKPSPERLRELLEELGPTFVKFGQIMAQRPDIVPEDYLEELKKLQDDVKAFPGEESKSIVDEEIGLDVFDEFNEEPVAAASIAQVHEAWIDGEKVAVKVRRPGIKDQITTDLDLMRYMAAKGEKHSETLRDIRVSKLVEEFADWTMDELDLTEEAMNAQAFKKNLEDEEDVKVPEVYPENTTEKVLVMEFVEGTKSTNNEKIDKLDLDREKIAETGIRSGLKQTIRDGLFHADPHPSNFLIQEDNTLVYLDFGMMGKITPKTKDQMGLILMHTLNEDIEGAMSLIEDMAYIEDDADLEGLKKDIEEKMLELRNSTLKQNSITSSMLEITVSASEKGVHMPSSFVLVSKTLLTLESIGLNVYPEFEIQEEYQDMAKDMLLKNNGPKDIMESFAIDLVQNKELISKAPSKINRTLENINKKQQHQVIQEKASGNSKAIIITGLLVSSSIFAFNSFPSQWSNLVALTEIILAFFLMYEVL
ncbi:MAG: ABC1 kinase family protein [Candidatus Nanohalobium sp.]